MTSAVQAWHRLGYERIEGEPEVEFRLKYDGPLLAEQRSASPTRITNKHLIRKEIHKQLAVLWKSAHALRQIRTMRHPLEKDKTEFEWLAANFSRCGFRFVPVVCRRFRLICDLDILFLRRDEPGNIVKPGGDVDNRINTLFDALRIPGECSELGKGCKPDADEDPFYCLLEDDSLITGFRITTDRLLVPQGPDEHANEVSLVITVKVRPSEITGGSLLFSS